MRRNNMCIASCEFGNLETRKGESYGLKPYYY